MTGCVQAPFEQGDVFGLEVTVGHVLSVQLGNALQNGDQEGAELRVVGPAVRGDLLPHVPTWEEVAQQVWMLLAVVGGGQHASTEDPHHARRADALMASTSRLKRSDS